MGQLQLCKLFFPNLNNNLTTISSIIIEKHQFNSEKQIDWSNQMDINTELKRISESQYSFSQWQDR
jgi:hypothetical protein